MGAPAAFNFYTTLFTKLNVTLTTYFQNVATDLITQFTPVATTLLGIYVMFWGWSMLRGVISEPVTDGVQRIVRLTLIIAVALNVGRYNQYITDFLWQLPDSLAAVAAIGNSNPLTNTQFLDDFMGHFWDIFAAFSEYSFASPWSSTLNIPNCFVWLAGALVLLSGIILTAYSAFLLVMAKIGLAVLLALGPVFVLSIMFEATKRFFDAWLGQALNFIFVVVLTSAIIKLFLTIIQSYLIVISTPAALATPSLAGVLPAVAFCLIGFLVLMQVSNIASALGGGVAVSTLGAVSGIYSRTTRGIAASRPMNIRRQINRSKSDMRILARSTGVNAVWNKFKGK
ncbi:conjugal transfer protein [Desulfopila sp. IMCC35006]|uniref:type IV secretion system protein n=1 Tax=Desulfopila sp. IMCC35006 TaxID=2569542 RepID=UPI0010AB6BCA|nr:type IV secretion system protein [Desulfopila sp. IMCC35006]TKB23475.1 conjugal transfer protein [Desulfopila sp. IMCC35006]